jgi:hypothetical protein
VAQIVKPEARQIRRISQGPPGSVPLGGRLRRIDLVMLAGARVFAYRLLRISRGDVTELPGFDETTYAPEGQFHQRSVEELVSEFKLQRASTLALVNGIPPTAWPRVGTANGFRTSARALVYIILGHTAHHYRVLRERYRLPAT